MSESTSPDRKIPLPIELGASAGSDPPLLTPPTDIGEPGVAGESFAHGGQAALRSWVGAKLAGGMFLHHFAIGAWSVTLASYVKAHTGDSPDSMFAPGFVGMIYGAGPLGGLFSPSITGVLADRYFSSERLMAVLHILGAIATVFMLRADTSTELFVAVLMFYVFYLPAFTLMVSMSLHQFKEPDRSFPVVRACGTAGWVAAGVFVGWLWPLLTGASIEATQTPIKIGLVTELITAVYCLFLPHTPPPHAAGKPLGAADAPRARLGLHEIGELLRRKPFVTLLAIAVISHILPQFYYSYANVFLNWSGVKYAAAKMAWGQVSEIVCILLLPLMLRRFGVRKTILLGLTTWLVRYLLLWASAEPAGPWSPTMQMTAVSLHGLAFAFVYVSMQLAADRYAGRRLRATGQGLAMMAIQGFGYFSGAQAAGLAGRSYLPPELDHATPDNWRQFWGIPAVGSAFVLMAAAIFLPRDQVSKSKDVRISEGGSKRG